jgi:hypothetical protein
MRFQVEALLTFQATMEVTADNQEEAVEIAFLMWEQTGLGEEDPDLPYSIDLERAKLVE